MLYEKKTSDVYQNSRSFICSICDLGSTDTEQNNDRTENVDRLAHNTCVHESHESKKHLKCSTCPHAVEHPMIYL